ncbi:hypothetical protein Tco_1132299 [Tanacetum coccineum]|uniref:Uncharacterized protein n=1 Tax=Tanacetum coccineum TaxID=301880 RepID=A0ABQ5JEK3_9ASTR
MHSLTRMEFVCSKKQLCLFIDVLNAAFFSSSSKDIVVSDVIPRWSVGNLLFLRASFKIDTHPLITVLALVVLDQDPGLAIPAVLHSNGNSAESGMSSLNNTFSGGFVWMVFTSSSAPHFLPDRLWAPFVGYRRGSDSVPDSEACIRICVRFSFVKSRYLLGCPKLDGVCNPSLGRWVLEPPLFVSIFPKASLLLVPMVAIPFGGAGCFGICVSFFYGGILRPAFQGCLLSGFLAGSSDNLGSFVALIGGGAVRTSRGARKIGMLGPTDGTIIKENLREPLRLNKWASIFMVVWFSSTPLEVAPLYTSLNQSKTPLARPRLLLWSSCRVSSYTAATPCLTNTDATDSEPEHPPMAQLLRSTILASSMFALQGKIVLLSPLKVSNESIPHQRQLSHVCMVDFFEGWKPLSPLQLAVEEVM